MVDHAHSDIPRPGALERRSGDRREAIRAPWWCILSAALLLAACGDESSPDSPSADAGADADAGVAPDVDPGDGPAISELDLQAQTTRITVSWATDQPATTVVAYGLTANYELGTEVGRTLSTAHRITIESLEPSTEYQLRIVSTNADGLSAVSDGHVVTTLDPGAAEPAARSDDFSASNLDPGLWSFIDPVGRGRVAITGTGTADARLELFVPPGPVHDVWTTNDGVRVMQPVQDIDFELEVKFESTPVENIQMQGILVEEDPDSWLRFDFHRNVGALSVFASRTLNGRPEPSGNTEIADGPGPIYLRVSRTGDTWTQSVSRDGETWDLMTTFQQPMTVTAVGVFGGNALGGGRRAPGHTVLVDYFMDTAAPVAEEDGATPDDGLAPSVHDIAFGMSARSMHVEVATDEPATAIIEYGLTTEYELGTVAVEGERYLHRFSIDGLDGTLTHHFRVVAEDGEGNRTESEDTELDWTVRGLPVIDVWYGDQQVFGALGRAQLWANVLGNVFATGGATLTYTLNGGPVQPLNVGPDNARLLEFGDFNIELGFDELAPGTNEIVLEATDTSQQTSSRTITVEYDDGNVWPLNYDVDWGEVTNIQDVVQVVDGLWTWDDEGARPAVIGYDRLFAIGDVSWQDYEVTFSITVFERVEASVQLIGVGLRWPGHTATGSTRPRTGYWPAGAFTWYRWTGAVEQLQLIGNFDEQVDNVNGDLQHDTTYALRVRVESPAEGGSTYSVRMWEQATAEPADWDATITEDVDDPQTGSLLFVVHNTDAVFGDISVRPVEE